MGLCPFLLLSEVWQVLAHITPEQVTKAILLQSILNILASKADPNQASLPIHDQLLNKGTDFKNPEHKANFYDTANNRAKNITIDGTTGNTVEFWFRSDGPLNTSKAIFDAWNGDNTSATQIGSASYGRMLLENRFETSGDPGPPDLSLFHFTYHSGTTGASRVPIFPFSVIGTPVDDVFNHYAVTVRNSGNKLNIKTFINGDIVDNLLTGTAVSEVTGDTAGELMQILVHIELTHRRV